MEKLVDAGLLDGVLDVTTTEIADELVGGVLSRRPATGSDAIARTRIPYVGSLGALDMVNFWALDTVPERFAAAPLHRHNPKVTLMRTTAEENAARSAPGSPPSSTACDGPVRFLIPRGRRLGARRAGPAVLGPGGRRRALRRARARRCAQTADRRLVRLPLHINDPAFAAALVAACREIAPPAPTEG